MPPGQPYPLSSSSLLSTCKPHTLNPSPYTRDIDPLPTSKSETQAFGILQEEGLVSNLTRAGWLRHELRSCALLKLLRGVSGASNTLRRMTCAALIAAAGPELRSAEGGAVNPIPHIVVQAY